MKKINVLFLFAFLCTCFIVRAQKGTMKLSADYSFAFPMRDLADFVDDKVSPRGWGASLIYNFTDNFSAGIGVGYQYFYKKYARQVYHTDGSDISAVLTNTAEMMPVLVKFKYNFIPRSPVQPFIGVGAGINVVLYDQMLGEYSWDSHNRVAFTASPEAGVFFPLTKNNAVGITLGAAYNFVPFNFGVVDNLDNLCVKAGISIGLKQ